MSIPTILLSAYGIVALLVLLFITPHIAEEIFPSAASTQFRLRVDAPDGTRVAVTEQLVKRVLASIRETAGDKNLDLSLGYVGTQGSSYPINAVFLWTSGPQQAIINVGLKPESSLQLADLEEQLRKKLPQQFPEAKFSFDPGDLISQILSFGSSSLAEVTVAGPQYADVASYAERVRQKLAAVPELRDLEYEEPLHYPTVDIKVNRTMAGQLGATADAVGSAVVSATASSRFVAPSYWRDPRSGVSYQVQVQVPQPKMTSLADIGNIPVGSTTGAQPLLNQLADLRSSTVPGELDRQNGQWMLALSANLGGRDLRRANNAIEKAVIDAGAPPRGVTTAVRGQVSALQQIFGELAIGLLAAIGVILLLLTANFQSLKLALVVLSTAPAVLAGSVLMLFAHWNDVESGELHGNHHGDWCCGCERDSACQFCGTESLEGRERTRGSARCGCRAAASSVDDESCHDCGNDPDGARLRSRKRRNGATGACRDRWSCSCDRRHALSSADGLWSRAAQRIDGNALTRSGRSR